MISKKNQPSVPKPFPFNIINTRMSATVTANIFLAPINVSNKLCRRMSNTSLNIEMDNDLSSSNSNKSFLSKTSKKKYTNTNAKITFHDLAKNKKVVTREDIIEFYKD